jgi:hypothetical protein
MSFCRLSVLILSSGGTYFFLAALLAIFGLLFGLGLVSRRLACIIYQITSFSLLIQQVIFVGGGPLCNSSGSYVFEFYGTKESRDYLETQSIPFFKCWTKLKSVPTNS